MRAFADVTRLTMAAALALTLGAVPLAGCGGGAAESSEPKATEEPVAEEEATADAAADEQDAGPIWVISKQVNSYGSGEDTATISSTFERDEHGNTLSMTQSEVPMEGESAEDLGSFTEQYELDEDGYMTASFSAGQAADGEDVREEYTLKKDDEGNLIERTSSDGDLVMKQTFGENRVMTSREVTQTYVGYDAEGAETEYTYKVTIAYGEDGHVTAVDVADDDYKVRGEYEYERDDKGKVTKATYREWPVDDKESVHEVTSTVEYDKDGNVSRVTTTDGEQTSTVEYEWVKVENPSLGARAEAAVLVL